MKSFSPETSIDNNQGINIFHIRMKTILLLVAAVAILTNMAQATPNRNLLLERLIFGEGSLTDKLDRTEKNENEMGSASQACCYPKSFQSTVHVYQPGMSAPVQGKLYVDAGNHRVASVNGARRVVVSCSCCACMTTAIDETHRLCLQQIQTGVNFDDVFQQCVPPKATPLGTVRMGTDGPQRSSMVVQQWAYADGNANIRRLATANGCFPVAEVMTRTTGSCQSELIDVHYFDVSSPIKDQSVFAIPPYCRRAEEVEEVGNDEMPDWTSSFFLRFFK